MKTPKDESRLYFWGTVLYNTVPPAVFVITAATMVAATLAFQSVATVVLPCNVADAATTAFGVICCFLPPWTAAAAIEWVQETVKNW